MLKKGSQDTKLKIMEAAFELFGIHGFEGTSIREISKKSEVNLAAINYHFQSKEKLFWEIMASIYVELDLEIKGFAETSKNTSELAMKTYDYYMTQQSALLNIMKMMLTDLEPDVTSPAVQAALTNPMGPPGGQYFGDMIAKEIPYELSREGLLWGIKSVFGVVHHWAVMCCSHCAKVDTDPLMSETQIRKDVESMVQSHIQFLSQQKSRFGK